MRDSDLALADVICDAGLDEAALAEARRVFREVETMRARGATEVEIAEYVDWDWSFTLQQLRKQQEWNQAVATLSEAFRTFPPFRLLMSFLYWLAARLR
jgi:hypothetical protein